MSDDTDNTNPVMHHYLALKLRGVMQAWGGHTLEDLRHTAIMPTRSGIIGLLAACLGIDRQDYAQLEALANSLTITLRADKPDPKSGIKVKRIIDFHTVKDARKVDGKRNKYPVVSRREYLCDAVFTLLIEVDQAATPFSIEALAKAVQNPVYMPFLGRRSCPLTRPLYEDEIQAHDSKSAFALLDSISGTLYSDQPISDDDIVMYQRDIPLYQRKRQFANRQVHVHPFNAEQTPKDNEDHHVLE